MKLINKYIVVILLFIPTTAFACYPAKVSLQQRVAAAQQIVVGVVTQVVPEVAKDKNSNSINAVSQPDETYSLKVSVSEVLKGEKNQSIIQPQIINCGSGKAGLDDKVVVFLSDGFWYTRIFKQQEYSDLVKLTGLD